LEVIVTETAAGGHGVATRVNTMNRSIERSMYMAAKKNSTSQFRRIGAASAATWAKLDAALAAKRAGGGHRLGVDRPGDADSPDPSRRAGALLQRGIREAKSRLVATRFI
jgi:hypothetical protein